MKSVFRMLAPLALSSSIFAQSVYERPFIFPGTYDSYYQKNFASQMELPKSTYSEAVFRLFVDKDEVYPAAWEMIQNAETSILFDMYLFGGEIADHMLSLLVEKMKAGVEVRLILDEPKRNEDARAVNQQEIFSELYGENVAEFQPVESRSLDVKPPFKPKVAKAIALGIPIVHAEPKFIPNSGMVRINHQKLLLVDGKRALIGGMNFATTVQANRDFMVEVAGPFVREMETIFLNTWKLGFALSNEGIRQYDESVALEDMQKLRSEGWHAGEAVATLTAPYLKNTRDELIQRIDAAEKSIEIEQLLFNETEVLRAVSRAALRGVQIRILLDPAEHLYSLDWKGGPNNKAIAFVQELQEKNPGIQIEARHYDIAPGQELHIKLIIIDQKEVGLGSTNFTSGAFQSNYETFSFVRSAGLAKELGEVFEHDWEKRSRIVEPLGLGRKIIGFLSDLLF